MKHKIISSGEQAVFEAGIKLGALYHQFTGAPISPTSVDSMEKAIEESIALQPYVIDITVKIDRGIINARLNEFGYCEIEGRMLDVTLVTQVGCSTATVSLSYDSKLEYPLMKILQIDEN
jgi:hypothetical protein